MAIETDDRMPEIASIMRSISPAGWLSVMDPMMKTLEEWTAGMTG